MRNLAGVAVLLAVLASASAGDVPASAPASFESHRVLKPFTYDEKDGNYNSQNVPIDCATNAIWLKAHFTRLGKPSTQWAPLMSASVESAQMRATAQIVSEHFQPPLHVWIATINLKDKSDKEATALYATFDLETPVPLLVSWTADGLVTFNVGGETRMVSLKGPVLQASLIGSTSAGVFDPLETGRLTGTSLPVNCAKPAP